MDSEHHGSGTLENGVSKPQSPAPVKPEKESSVFSFVSESDYKEEEHLGHYNPFLYPEEGQTGILPPVVSVESNASNPRINFQGSPILSAQPMAGSYDPGRIPASVFASKPTTPMDWSVASNESLFSIHVGNSSFSRDHVFMLFKSGELPKLDDYISVPPSEFPAIEPDKPGRESFDLGKDIKEGKFVENTKSELADNIKISQELSTGQTPKANQLDVLRKNNPDTMHVSHEEIRISTSSVQSFHFPLLDSDRGKDGSVKVVGQKQNLEKKIDEEVHFKNHGRTTATKSGWFSCFTCCTLG